MSNEHVNEGTEGTVKYSDLTPYSGYRIVERWCASHPGVKLPSSQAFYGFARRNARGESKIASYRVSTYPHEWMRGEAFAQWFDQFKAGTLPNRRGSDLHELFSEYDV